MQYCASRRIPRAAIHCGRLLKGAGRDFPGEAMAEVPDMHTYATVRKAGWMKDDEGREFFGAVLEYPQGPPGHLTASLVWDHTPVKIVVIDQGPEA